MAKYRKKPVEVDAVQWFPGVSVEGVTPATELEGYLVERICIDLGFDKLFELHQYAWIKTLEGGHIVESGDWIITGVKGEKCPCKPDIFDQTYELA